MRVYSRLWHGKYRCRISDAYVIADEVWVEDGLIILRLDGDVVATAPTSCIFVRAQKIIDEEDKGDAAE